MKVGKERAKAWIYAVVNPLLEALRTEDVFLAKGNWTFRHYNRDLEFVRPIESYVDYESRPIWEDFASNSQLRDDVRRRDEQRNELRKTCSAAFDEILSIPEFKPEVERRLAEYLRYEGGGLGQDTEKTVAELVVNNASELPSHYTYSRFWAAFGAELKKRFRRAALFDPVDQAGQMLRKGNDALVGNLKKLRADLADEHDIPWAPYHDESLALPMR